MPPRTNPSIAMLIAQAQERMRESKELQFFGGDALNLKRWKQTVSIPLDSTVHCWRVVLVPENTETTMPFNADFRPGDANTYPSGTIEAVHRTDGAFEYLFIMNPEFSDQPAQNVIFFIEYTGTATVTITQIG